MDERHEGHDPARSPWSRAWHSRHRRTMGRYVTASAGSTAVSQVLLAGSYALGADVVLASALGYLGGVPVNYLLQRRWTWGDRDAGPRLVRYLATVAVSAVVVVTLTTFLEAGITALGLDRPLEVALVSVAFLGVTGTVFLAKYVLFDRLVFAERRDGTATSASTLPASTPPASTPPVPSTSTTTSDHRA